MIIVPGQSTLTESRRSRELAARVDQVVREYRSDHPEITDQEVRSALMHSAPFAGDDPFPRQRRIAGIAIAAALVAGFTVMASTGGGKTLDPKLIWPIVGAVAAAAGVAIAVMRIRNRD